jgi:acylphosphatase
MRRRYGRIWAMDAVRLRAVVRGRVQGVFFRGFTERSAAALGLRGWVRNRSDGGVEVLAEGPRADLLSFLEAIQRGPSPARVDAVEAEWLEASGEFPDFRIRSSLY